MSDSAILEVCNLKKHFSQNQGGLFTRHHTTVKAVDDVSFKLKRGEILGLVGESGCGKSTTARCIMQLETPTSGRICLDGDELAGLSPRQLREKRPNFQMVFQDPYASLNPRMRVSETIREAIKCRHRKISKQDLQQRCSTLMAQVGLSERALLKYPHEFSGGQRQRIAIARALATEPKLLIADEPVSSLDVSVQAQILNLLRKISKDLGLSMIFIGHDLSVMRYIADKIVVMYQGRIVELGDAVQIVDTPQHEYSKKLMSAIPRMQFSQ